MTTFISGMNGSNNKTYDDLNAQCTSNGMKMCSYKDYCKSVNNPLFTPQTKDTWAPISDSVNDWVQIGTGTWPNCIKHTELYDQNKKDFDEKGFKRNPYWGVTPASNNVMYSCCNKTCSDINCKLPQVCDPKTLTCVDPPSKSTKFKFIFNYRWCNFFYYFYFHNIRYNYVNEKKKIINI